MLIGNLRYVHSVTLTFPLFSLSIQRVTLIHSYLIRLYICEFEPMHLPSFAASLSGRPCLMADSGENIASVVQPPSVWIPWIDARQAGQDERPSCCSRQWTTWVRSLNCIEELICNVREWSKCKRLLGNRFYLPCIIVKTLHGILINWITYINPIAICRNLEPNIEYEYMYNIYRRHYIFGCFAKPCISSRTIENV